MKKHVLIALFLCALLPIFGQSNSDLTKENARLKTEIQQLKEQLAASNSQVVELTTRIKVAGNVLSESNTGGAIQAVTATNSVNYSTTTVNDEGAASAKAVQNKNQCKAITQAGTQCKRMASDGSDYCWQHQTTANPTATTSKATSTSTAKSTSSTSSSSRTILTGPRGGQYYINSNGNKTYIKR
jgi:colicin import membrane protein